MNMLLYGSKAIFHLVAILISNFMNVSIRQNQSLYELLESLDANNIEIIMNWALKEI